jgi:hypothetical protein
MNYRAILAFILSLISFHLHAFNEEKFAHALGLELVSEGHPYNFLGVHTMYANNDLSRQMLVIRDVKAPLQEMRIIKASGYLILEIPKDENTYGSMALVGISEDEIRTKITTTSFWQKLWYELHPLRKAYSDDCTIRGVPDLNGLENLKNFYGSSLAKGAVKCIGQFFQGAWAATGGQVAGAIEGIENLITDPKAFWDKKVEQMKNLKKFITHFDSKMKELHSAVANLPAETKTMMICSFVGGLGADAAIAILAGGVGLAKALLKVEDFVSQIMKLEKVFMVLDKVGKLRSIPPMFFERLSSSQISQSLLDSLSVFAGRNFPDLILGAMQCAL